MENLRRILNASWRLERWITRILHQSPNNTLAAALIDEVFKSSISHHLLFLSHLSRPSPVMATETLCCVCRSDGRWPTEKFQSAGASGRGGLILGLAVTILSATPRNDNLTLFSNKKRIRHNLLTAPVTDQTADHEAVIQPQLHDNRPMPLIADQRWTIIILIKMGH